MAKKIKWEKYVPHPSISLILGGRGSGKTVTACSILDRMRKWHKCYVCGSKEYVKHYPKWIRRTTINNLDIPNSVILIDDAHLSLYARDWSAKGDRETHKSIDYLARQSRHKDISFIVTTQQARVVDINLVSMVDCVIIKQPSLLQSEFERRELKKLFEEAAVQLKGKGKGYAFIVYKGGKKVIGPYKPPKWYNKKISKGFKEVKVSKKANKKSPILKYIIDGVKVIGRM